jgi:hypothetical protein
VSEARRVDADAPLEASRGRRDRQLVEAVAQPEPLGCVHGVLEVDGSRRDLGDEGGCLPCDGISPISCCVHDLGGVVEALSEASSTPERRVIERSLAGAQLGLGSA